MDKPDTRTIALFLAILHHGMSNLATKSVPAGWQTVIGTSDKFKEYLEGRNPRHDR